MQCSLCVGFNIGDGPSAMVGLIAPTPVSSGMLCGFIVPSCWRVSLGFAVVKYWCRALWGILLFSVLVFGANPAFALDIIARDGTKYRQVTITNVDERGLGIIHRDGLVRIPYRNLPESMQRKYLGAFQKVAENLAAERKRVADAQQATERANEIARRDYEEARRLRRIPTPFPPAMVETPRATNPKNEVISQRAERGSPANNWSWGEVILAILALVAVICLFVVYPEAFWWVCSLSFIIVILSALTSSQGSSRRR